MRCILHSVFKNSTLLSNPKLLLRLCLEYLAQQFGPESILLSVMARTELIMVSGRSIYLCIRTFPIFYYFTVAR